MGCLSLIISKGILQKGQLNGNVALITGAGGGIGFETARSLIWLGVKVIIAEIDKAKGKGAESQLNNEFGENNALFIHTDIGDERSVRRLAGKVNDTFGKLDIIVNNATITPMGAVHKVGIDKWDLSYRTNLRGPVLLISKFLPDMIERNSGIIVLVPSSGAAPYMGAYEVFKTAQVELANTLSAELEQTGIITFSIGPGLVKTETAVDKIKEVAPLYGKTVDEFYKMSENMILSAEEAGAGFAASIANASRYRGLEIGSIQALMDAGIKTGEQKVGEKINLTEEKKNCILVLLKQIEDTFEEQVQGWSGRSVFERQWVVRDFKKHTGSSAETFIESLKAFEDSLINNTISSEDVEKLPVDKICSYYKHQLDLMKGYERNPQKVEEYTGIIQGWLKTIDEFKVHTKEM